jgi:nucleotide-binding universal stress UspA family protein
LATFIYFLLALTMLNVNPVAWIVTIFWSLVGLINYFSYAKNQSRESFESEIVYEEAVRVVPRTGRRILMPVPSTITTEELKNLAEMAFAIASKYHGEIIAVTVHTIPHPLMLVDGATMTRDQHLFEHLKQWVQEFNRISPREQDINLHSLAMVGRDTVDSLLEVIKMEECDMMILAWGGYSSSKGVVFGSKIDRILRETTIDLILVKNPQRIKSVLLVKELRMGNPYVSLTGEVLDAVKTYFRPKMRLVSVVPLGKKEPDIDFTKKLLLTSIGRTETDFEEVKVIPAKSVIMTIIKEANFQKEGKLVIISASSPHMLKEIRMGAIPELLAKHVDASVMIVRGHQGMVEAKWETLLRKFS